MKEKTREKFEKLLLENGLINVCDSVIEVTRADYSHAKKKKWTAWQRCWLIYTNEKLVLTSALIGYIVIEYGNITSLTKARSWFMNSVIEMEHISNNFESVASKDRIFVTKRQNHLDIIESKSEIVAR